MQVVLVKGLLSGILKVRIFLDASQAGSHLPLKLRGLIMHQKIATWSLSDSPCSICSVMGLAHLPCLGLIARKVSIICCWGWFHLGLLRQRGSGPYWGSWQVQFPLAHRPKLCPKVIQRGEGSWSRLPKEFCYGFGWWKWIQCNFYWSWWKWVCFFVAHVPSNCNEVACRGFDGEGSENDNQLILAVNPG